MAAKHLLVCLIVSPFWRRQTSQMDIFRDDLVKRTVDVKELMARWRLFLIFLFFLSILRVLFFSFRVFRRASCILTSLFLFLSCFSECTRLHDNISGETNLCIFYKTYDLLLQRRTLLFDNIYSRRGPRRTRTRLWSVYDASFSTIFKHSTCYPPKFAKVFIYFVRKRKNEEAQIFKTRLYIYILNTK